jgi:hypothetical protein
MPCYISGNTHPTLPHCFGNRAWEVATEAGSMSSTSGCGAMVWGQLPCKVTVAQAAQRHRDCLTESQKRAVQTLRRRREQHGLGARGRAGDMDAVDSVWKMNEQEMMRYIPWYYSMYIPFDIHTVDIYRDIY